MSKTKNIENFLSEITKIFGLDPDEDSDHKLALQEVKDAMKKHLEV